MNASLHHGLLFDLDGVLYQGETPVTGAVETLAWVREQGIPHLFLTNTTSRPRSALVDKLGRMGIDIGSDRLLTPPVAAVRWLDTYVQGPVALFVPEATRAEFESLDLAAEDAEKVAAVVVGDLGEGWDYATLNRAFRLLMHKPQPRLVALGMTRYWQAADGLRLDAGAFVAALSHASGVAPIVLGKPATPFFHTACEILGIEPAAGVMIGDDIRGDVEGAQQAGLAAIQVRTGKFRPADLEQGVTPDTVLDSVADLPAWWAQR
ncbi:TIGR01458 family HAD-type hydrolase [Thiohalobacter thiocyanaticus]|uniref:Haloacid dehalogenase-like hydrolase domain-containing protein 2 n=1 Tax=Thiohalobacter thiocyanaticus TaxID=585455 RepID=A0A426QKW1_9GAMM|nr:TIGR01458 family HAD-type hydrolase [Thiohalobacter thiocyanaticus]RRQ22395.1 TIGR01458 family HAD-type hydrolase [Thiohalobacter thiocyanaticus]